MASYMAMNKGNNLITCPSPIGKQRSIKNPVELERMRDVVKHLVLLSR